MRINIEWLKEWVETDLAPEEIASELTTAGLEVDAVYPAAPELSGVRVARVLDVQPHPNADRLSVCQVESGDESFEIVCGAPNVRAGISVPLAPAGTMLPGGQKIKAAKIRGVASNGMLCSGKELGLSDDSGGLLVLDPSADSGSALLEHLRLPDWVVDIDLTPNRGDCFSVLGIAREVAARRGSAMRDAQVEPVEASIDDAFAVQLSAGSACPRFAGRVIRNLSVEARSPDWLKERLRRAGMRPIHPVVDVTNYVMLELGQPLHAYRLDRLAGRIDVRFAAPGERLELLDGSNVELADDVLVIADDSGPIGLAGIMGGQSTAVDDTSTDIFLESAYFSPDAVQGRARRYGLHTDASVRFERGVDFAEQARAIERASELLAEIAGGAFGPTIVHEKPEALPQRNAIELRRDRIQTVLGAALDTDEIEGWLQRLGMRAAGGDGHWTVTAPSYRFDIEIEEDLIEELGRMVGYDNIEPVRASAPVSLGDADERRVHSDELADLLTARGYSEIVSYSFIDDAIQRLVLPDAEPARLANPISSELGVLRGSLWPGLLQAARINLSRQQTRCRLFEIGTTFSVAGEGIRESTALAGIAMGPVYDEHWDIEDREVDYFDIKADMEAMLALTGRARKFDLKPATHPALSPASCASVSLGDEIVGWIGSLHPTCRKHFEFAKDAVMFELRLSPTFEAEIPSFKPFSKYPSVRRDLAVIVEESVPASALVSAVEETIGEALKRTVVFDLYRGETIGSSRKSIGLGLILQDASRTLTDDDADRMLGAVMRRLEHELGATIRT